MTVGTGLESALRTAGAVRVLLALLEHGPLGATELTEAIDGYTAQGITASRSLEAAGLVTVDEHPGVGGKPSYVIALTDLGAALAKAIRPTALVVPDPPKETVKGLRGARPLREGRDSKGKK